MLSRSLRFNASRLRNGDGLVVYPSIQEGGGREGGGNARKPRKIEILVGRLVESAVESALSSLRKTNPRQPVKG